MKYQHKHDWRTHFRDALDRHRWTNAEVARRIGVPYNTFSNWLAASGKRGEPSIDYMVAIAEATGLTLDELFRGVIPPQPIDVAIAKATQLLTAAIRDAFREACVLHNPAAKR